MLFFVVMYCVMLRIRYKQKISSKTMLFLSPFAANSCLPLSDDWKRYKDNCYTVMLRSSTWRQARAICQESQADLVSITNMIENAFVLSLVCESCIFFILKADF